MLYENPWEEFYKESAFSEAITFLDDMQKIAKGIFSQETFDFARNFLQGLVLIHGDKFITPRVTIQSSPMAPAIVLSWDNFNPYFTRHWKMFINENGYFEFYPLDEGNLRKWRNHADVNEAVLLFNERFKIISEFEREMLGLNFFYSSLQLEKHKPFANYFHLLHKKEFNYLYNYVALLSRHNYLSFQKNSYSKVPSIYPMKDWCVQISWNKNNLHSLYSVNIYIDFGGRETLIVVHNRETDYKHFHKGTLGNINEMNPLEDGVDSVLQIERMIKDDQPKYKQFTL